MKSGGENAAYAPAFQNLPHQAGQPAPVAGATVDANQLLPAQRTYWRYNGSLTPPPCTEGVKWLVMNTPIEVSDAQIAGFTAIFQHNQRPVQPFHSRTFLVPITLPKTGGVVVTLDGALVGAGVLIIVSGMALGFISRRKAI